MPHEGPLSAPWAPPLMRAFSTFIHVLDVMVKIKKDFGAIFILTATVLVTYGIFVYHENLCTAY